MVKNDELFSGFYQYTQFQNILMQFTDYPALYSILKILQAAELLDEWIVKRYSAINMSYCKEGFKGILSYELKSAKEGKKQLIGHIWMLLKLKRKSSNIKSLKY